MHTLVKIGASSFYRLFQVTFGDRRTYVIHIFLHIQYDNIPSFNDIRWNDVNIDLSCLSVQSLHLSWNEPHGLPNLSGINYFMNSNHTSINNWLPVSRFPKTSWIWTADREISKSNLYFFRCFAVFDSFCVNIFSYFVILLISTNWLVKLLFE